MRIKIKKQITTIALLLCLPVAVLAEESTPVNININVNAGMAPSSSFYFLDTLFERMGIWLADDTDEEVSRLLEYANEKLSEMNETAEEDEDAATKAGEQYQKYIEEAVDKAKNAQDDGSDVDDQLQKISSATLTHITALVEVGGKAAEAESPYIEDALETIQEQEQEVLSLIQDEEKRAKAAQEVLTFLQETNEKIPPHVRENIQSTLATLVSGISAFVLEHGGAVVDQLGDTAKEFARQQANKQLDAAKDSIIDSIEGFEF